MALKEVSCNKMFDGLQKVFSHESEAVKCTMKFGVYLPPQADKDKCPVLYFLSGLTCTEQNFVTKACAQKTAAELGIIIVAPDTSPRGCNIAGEDDSYDLGTGAGFYVDATQPPWRTNYQMFSYVTKELPALIDANFPTRPGHQGIFGHSMGGHGALVCALKCPGKYLSVSAFAPICHPTDCPWGDKALGAYLGADRSGWAAWDAVELVRAGHKLPGVVLVDQGTKDEFHKIQLKPESLSAIAEQKDGVTVQVNMREGYDHSYYFIASFMEDHIRHHARYLFK